MEKLANDFCKLGIRAGNTVMLHASVRAVGNIAGDADTIHSHSNRCCLRRERKALTLFEQSREVSAKEIAKLLGFQQRPAAALCQWWVTEGFLVVADPSKKARRYRLKDELEERIAAQL